MSATTDTRTGGRLVADVLEQLGAQVAFGLPGIHALPIWDALRDSPIRLVTLRTELDAGFAADGYARVTGDPTPLLLSTGPGALIALGALMEAASSHVPVVAIASQVPDEFAGKGRGFLHELPDQIASFAPVVKHALHVGSVEEIAPLLAEAWAIAARAPSGPVFVQIPTDLLHGPAPAASVAAGLPGPAAVEVADAEALDRAAELLTGASAPVVWSGGGVIRGAAWTQVRELAERLDAPVVTTYMGKGALPETHPLAVGSCNHDEAVQGLLSGADVVLAIGTELGSDTTEDWTLKLPTLVQLDADPARFGATYEPAVALVGDAAPTLRALLERLPPEPADRGGAERVRAVRAEVDGRVADAEHHPEVALVRAIRAALPTDAVDAWDSTILGYWGASFFEAREPRRFLYPLGSGTIGYGWPAAVGAAAASPDRPVIAVVGDGGFQYGIAELAAARQHSLPVKLVLVDDGGYGILREYQRDAFGELVATDLEQPHFAALIESFGVPVRRSSIESLGEDVAWALSVDGPAAVVLRARLAWYRESG